MVTDVGYCWFSDDFSVWKRWRFAVYPALLSGLEQGVGFNVSNSGGLGGMVFINLVVWVMLLRLLR
jgi:hypothetical protein